MADVYFGSVAVLTPGVSHNWSAGQAMLSCDRSAAPWSAAWFDVKQQLPGIKHRYLNDTSRYCLAAAMSCLRSSTALEWHGAAEERRGVIVGTAVADYAVREHYDRSVLNDETDALSAISSPNISANIASAHVSIACHARAFASTLTSPFLAGFESLAVGFMAVRSGRADAVLAIAAEEALPAADDQQITPGAIACGLQRQPSTACRRLVDVCWGRHQPSSARLAKDAERFLTAIAANGTQLPDWVVIRDRSTPAANTARTWLQHAQCAGVAVTPRELLIEDVGTVGPLLAAISMITDGKQVVLLVIYQSRYVVLFIE